MGEKTMKNTILYIGLIIAGYLLIFNNSIVANEKQGHIYLIRTHKSNMPENGRITERDSLIVELVKLHRSNKKVLRVITLIPHDSSDFQDWVVIYEYKNYEDIDEATKIDLELNKRKWPNDIEREKFFQRLSDYFPTHIDKVYIEIPKFRQ